MMFGEFFPAPRAGRDRDGTGAERFSAGDIARRIADDVDLLRRKFAAVLFFRAGAGECSEFIAIVVVVGESAEFKKMPDAVVAELELCPAGNVAREQAEHEMFSCFQSFEQLEHAGKKVAFAARQFERKKMDVTVEKGGDVFGRRWDFVFLQDADDDSGIGHAGDFDAVKVVMDAEALCERKFECLNTGAPGMNQGAVDIEKKKALLHSSTDYADFRR